VRGRATRESGATWRALFTAFATLIAVGCCWLSVAGAHAQAPTALPYGVDVHAFVSQGFIWSAHNNYLARSKRGSAEFSELGLNFTKQVSDDLRIGVQLFARDLGPDGNYRPQLDWYYLDYRLFDWLGIRAGRTKIPFGLYNEVNDVDAARVPILLPQSMYPSDNRELLLAVTGGELYGNVPLGPVGQLEYRAYGGTIFAALPRDKPGLTYTEARVPYAFGGRLTWFTPIEGLQLGSSGQAVRLETDYTYDPAVAQLLVAAKVAPEGFNGKVNFTLPVRLWVLSAEYAWQDLLLSAEYSRRLGTLTIDPIVPRTYFPNERYYVMASYRILRWLTPGVYYSALYPDSRNRGSREERLLDFAGTIRFDLTDHWLVKLEGHLMRGTADLSEDLNGAPPDKLRKNWGALLIKTTAYF